MHDPNDSQRPGTARSQFTNVGLELHLPHFDSHLVRCVFEESGKYNASISRSTSKREQKMSKSLVFGTAAAALTMLAGCASDYSGYNGYGYTVAAGYGVPVYYDGFYGPYWNGYWTPDGHFQFALGPGRLYRPDYGGHFSNVASVGFRRMADATIQSG